MAPRAGRPWINLSQVFAESKLSQLTLDELSDVPRQVVVSGEWEWMKLIAGDKFTNFDYLFYREILEFLFVSVFVAQQGL